MQKLTQQVVYLYIKFTLLFHSLGYWFRLRKARLIYKSGVSKQRSVLTQPKSKCLLQRSGHDEPLLARVTATYNVNSTHPQKMTLKKEKEKNISTHKPAYKNLCFHRNIYYSPPTPQKSIKICWLHKWSFPATNTSSRNKQNLTRQGTQDLECLFVLPLAVLGACSLVASAWCMVSSDVPGASSWQPGGWQKSGWWRWSPWTDRPQPQPHKGPGHLRLLPRGYALPSKHPVPLPSASLDGLARSPPCQCLHTEPSTTVGVWATMRAVPSP